MKKDDFQASDGWLDRFKKRYGIRLLSMTGEKLSSDTAAVVPFVDQFKEKVISLGLVPDQIYNADESGLNWRLLPNKTFVHRGEKSAPGRKVAKERITFMPCSNATGMHKLDLLVIGKSRKPRAFKNVTLPVKYMNQGRAWMTCEVFKEWYRNFFVPSVKQFLRSHNLPLKALLILDNAPGHPDVDDLRVKTADGFIEVLYMPANTSALIQPMDQNIIKMVKSHYKRSLLMDVVSQESDISASLSRYDIRDAVFNVALAWRKVPTSTIIKSWKPLWPSHPLLAKGDNDQDLLDMNESNNLQEISDFLSKKVPGPASCHQGTSESCSLEEIRLWLTEEDEEELILSDDQIIADILDTDNQTVEVSFDQPPPKYTVRCEEALSAFNTCLKWAEERNVDAEEYILLKKLRENVLKESFTVIKKQTTIESFFKQ